MSLSELGTAQPHLSDLLLQWLFAAKKETIERQKIKIKLRSWDIKRSGGISQWNQKTETSWEAETKTQTREGQVALFLVDRRPHKFEIYWKQFKFHSHLSFIYLWILLFTEIITVTGKMISFECTCSWVMIIATIFIILNYQPNFAYRSETFVYED